MELATLESKGVIIEPIKKKVVFQEIIEKDYQSLQDTDIAEYFLKWSSDSVFYNVDSKMYHIFDGKYYKVDKEALLLKNRIKIFLTELVDYANSKNVKKEIMNKIYRFKDEKKIAAVVQGIKVLRRTECKDIDKDEYIYLFNVQNGILDLGGKEPKLLIHSPEYLITEIADVEFKPELGEVTGTAKEILLSFFLNDESVLNFLFEFLGTALTGYAAIRKFIFAFGSGNNGKSTFFNFFLNEFFGSYGASANFQTFTKDRNNGYASSDLARILNKRLVVANEVKENQGLDTSLIKTITGGDPYQARLNYENEKTYKPRCKIVLFGNNQLSITDSSKGMQDRFSQIPFLAKFNGINKKEQSEIWRILRNNKSQILNSLIAGYYRYKSNTEFNVPSNIKEASLNGFASANNCAWFINLYLISEEGSQVKVKAVFHLYKQFTEDEELSRKEKLNRTGFVDSLKSNDIGIIDQRKTEYIKNYRLSEEENLL